MEFVFKLGIRRAIQLINILNASVKCNSWYNYTKDIFVDHVERLVTFWKKKFDLKKNIEYGL